MTGPEHYREAERLLAGVTLQGSHPDGSPIIRGDEPQTLAAAQVHATLALTAATALPGEHPGDWQREIWAFGLDAVADPGGAP